MSVENNLSNSTSNPEEASQETNSESTSKPVCFVIMPISEHSDYETGHFKRVFEDIFKPACSEAGFRAVRADQVRSTNMIHLDVLQKLIDSPMVLCDLSSRNPNVLFELGMRQAFDKPVVLVREVDTPDIFDITPLRYTEYRKDRTYHEVLQDQENIANAIKETKQAFSKGEGINSIVRLLSLTQPAALPEMREADKDPVLQIVRAEMSALRVEFRDALRVRDTPPGPTRGVLSEEDSVRRELVRIEEAMALAHRQVEQMKAGTESEGLSDLLEYVSSRIASARKRTNNPNILNTLRAFQHQYESAKTDYDIYQDFKDIPF